MSTLVSILSDAVNATRERRSEDAFRYLGTGLEILLPCRGSDSFDFEGSGALLALDEIRVRFEWLNRRVVPPGKTSRLRQWSNHMIILEDELWSEYVRSESPREIIKWHRDRLVSLLIGESENLPQRKQFYLSVLSALRVRRNRLAHQSKSDVDDYFLPAALSLYGLAIQFRFHAYLLWLEWCMKVKMRDSNPDGGIMALENAFGEGWLEEFNTWSHLVPAHFEEIAGSGKSYQKFLCLGAGFSGLPFTSQDSQPVMPISKRLDKSIRGFLGATQIRQGASQSVPVRE